MIRVYPDREELGRAAAQLFAEEARRTVEALGRFAVLLAGGETPRRCYQLLAQPPLREEVPWQRVHVFWGDERCVPPEDPRSNYGMARRALLDHVPVPAGQIHPIACDRSPGAAAAAYEKSLRAFFAGRPPRFDLVLLGLGENGHTASLFPGTPVLEERERWAAEVHVAAEAPRRVTVTAPLINQAALVVFLVAGKGKAAVLRDVLTGAGEPRTLPARLIRPEAGTLIWLADREAARQLHPETAQG